MIKRYKLKDGVTIDAMQWAMGNSFSKVCRHCGGYFMHTQTGLVRIGNGDWAVKGENGFHMVVKDEAFKSMFEEVKDG